MAVLAGMATMPISAIYPSNERTKGFTLLEMVVVLALVALLGAVVMPSLLKMQQAWKRRTELQDVAGQLSSLGYRARLQGLEVAIGPQGVVPPQMLSLPEHWSLTAPVPILYLANGACLGGRVGLTQAQVTEFLDLEAPLCQPKRP